MAGSDKCMNFAKKLSPAVYYRESILIVGRTTLKMLRRKSKTQFVKQERNTQKAIALLNYLKPIVPQQLMLRMQVYTKKILKRKEHNRNFIK
jgi:hypothetical protein